MCYIDMSRIKILNKDQIEAFKRTDGAKVKAFCHDDGYGEHTAIVWYNKSGEVLVTEVRPTGEC